MTKVRYRAARAAKKASGFELYVPQRGTLGYALILLLKSWNYAKHYSMCPYPPTMLWPCLLNLVGLSCPNASSILGDILSSPLNCDSCLEWYSFLSKSFLECFKRVLWVVVLLDQKCLPQLQKKSLKWNIYLKSGCLVIKHLSIYLLSSAPLHVL